MSIFLQQVGDAVDVYLVIADKHYYVGFYWSATPHVFVDMRGFEDQES
jgi:hypothetical protein